MRHWLYARVLIRKFRWTLFGVLALVAAGATLYRLSPHPPPLSTAIYAAWMAMFAQPIDVPETWYLKLLCALYPLLGFVLIGEGIVRLGLLMLSREQGEKEWMLVMASTFRDHVIVCGLGHLGARIVQQLVSRGDQVVVLEKRADCRFFSEAKATGSPILVRDMKDDASLIDAGIVHARAIVIATNDDMANLEVALDARRINPKIKILMRLFDQQIALKLKDALSIDHAFSSSALAAPIVVDLIKVQ